MIAKHKKTFEEVREFLDKKCCLENEFYEPPTPEDVKFARALGGVTQSDVAKLLKISRVAVQKWEVPKGKNAHRRIPFASWRLLLIKLNIVKANPLLKQG